VSVGDVTQTYRTIGAGSVSPKFNKAHRFVAALATPIRRYAHTPIRFSWLLAPSCVYCRTMKKRLFLLLLSACALVFASSALAGYVEIGRVSMPELTSSQWALLRQQQGPTPQIVPVDINVAVYQGTVYAVSVRHGSGYRDIDHTIVNWIATHWRTDNWFKGGDAYVVSLDVDPLLRHVVFRGNDGAVRARYPLILPLSANVAPVSGY
jgi:hypothetical protein